MSDDILPQSVRDGLEAARRAQELKKSRLRVEAGDVSIRVLRSWDGGFAIDAAEPVRLRGFVDLYEGVRHVSSCLILMSREEDGERVYDVKQQTPVADGPALDFERSETAPVALIEGKPGRAAR